MTPAGPVYLDHAATTPLDGRCLAAMLPFLGGTPGGASAAPHGNPSSPHAAGATAREAVNEARASVARLLDAAPEEIFFTSGGTEADNLAVFGLARASAATEAGKRHVVVSAVEHAAVRAPVAHLEEMGYEVTRVGVDADGLVRADEFARFLRPDTALAAVMWANNEVGTLQPIGEIAEICRNAGVPLHVDAVQAAGRVPINVHEVPVATLALSAHKLYGPQGVGALYVRGGVKLAPVVHGGGQERGLRSGTENVAGIVGFGEAARLALAEMEERRRHEEELRDALLSALMNVPGVRLNGHREERLSNNVHVCVDGVGAESLVLFLDALGYAVGSGSACASGATDHKASPVLLAMGRSEREALGALRVTVGKDTTRAEVDGFVGAISSAVARLRELSPLYTS